VHVFWHPRSLTHDPGPEHPESPARVAAILEELRRPPLAGVITWHQAKPADPAQLLRVHTQEYLTLLGSVAARGGGRLDVDTVMSSSSDEAARLAAGAAVAAAEIALAGSPAFALARPPGPH